MALRIFQRIFRKEMCAPCYSRSIHADTGRDIRIPVPWGYLAGKEWGKRGGIPVLACHGLMDNAGTFDRIAPLLPANYHFVCYELPGFGLSSPLPGGFYPSVPSFAADAKRVVNYFGWDECFFAGHSVGGGVGLYFAAMFPEIVTRLVCIDPGKLISGHAKETPDLIHGRVEFMLAIENSKHEPRLYTTEEAIKLLIEKSGNSLNNASAHIMLKRAVNTVDDHNQLVTFNYDKKNSTLLMPDLCAEQTVAMAHSVGANTDTLIISVNNGNIPEWAVMLDSLSLNNFLDICRSYGRCIQIQLEGTHHLHLNSPERILPYLVEFLETGKIERAAKTSDEELNNSA